MSWKLLARARRAAGDESAVTKARETSWYARVFRLVTTGFLSVCAVAVLAKAVGLQIVYTPSVPVGVYRRESLEVKGPPKRGEYVCLEGWRESAPSLFRATVQAGVLPADWIKSEPLVKRVAGVAGDRVVYVSNGAAGRVEINGEALAESAILERDRKGAVLPKPPYPFVLSPDEVWLTSQNPRGFDSRYFGPVRLSALGCRTKLLWAW